MEETLKTLSQYQLDALKKGISFRIDLDYNSKKNPVAAVEMNYTVTGDMAKGFVFNTTFSESTTESKRQEKLENIKYFINTIVGPQK